MSKKKGELKKKELENVRGGHHHLKILLSVLLLKLMLRSILRMILFGVSVLMAKIIAGSTERLTRKVKKS